MKAILKNLTIDHNWTRTRIYPQYPPPMFMNIVSDYTRCSSVIVTDPKGKYQTYSIRHLLQ